MIVPPYSELMMFSPFIPNSWRKPPSCCATSPPFAS